jgi:hypothetical protein
MILVVMQPQVQSFKDVSRLLAGGSQPLDYGLADLLRLIRYDLRPGGAARLLIKVGWRPARRGKSAKGLRRSAESVEFSPLVVTRTGTSSPSAAWWWLVMIQILIRPRRFLNVAVAIAAFGVTGVETLVIVRRYATCSALCLTAHGGEL